MYRSAPPRFSSDLIDLLPSPICVIDGNGSTLRLNSGWRAYAGLADSQEAPRNFADLIDGRDANSALDQLGSILATAAAGDVECRLRVAARDEARWFKLRVEPVGATSSAAPQWLCAATDIDDLKKRTLKLESRLQTITEMLNASVDCIKLISLDGRLLHMSRSGCQALGVPEDSPLGMPWLPLLPEDVRAEGEQALASARAGVFARFSGRSAAPGKPPQHWDNMLTPVLDATGQATAILCVSREVTGEREAVEFLRESQERLAIATHIAGLGIWDYDIQKDELYCDDNWYKIMGRDPSRPIRSIAEFRPFIHPDDVDQATEILRTTAELLASGADYANTFRIVRPDGNIRWVRSAAYLQDITGTAGRATGFVLDITEARNNELTLRATNRTLKAERRHLARQCLEDPLTGIANRRHFDTELLQLSQKSEGTGERICLGMIDVDHFKAFNDHYGHLEGDAALRRVAQALQSVVGKFDVAARVGGEEFAFILTNRNDPTPVLKRLMAAVNDLAIPHELSPTGRLSVSCGCARFSFCGQLTVNAVLRQSDEALYEAKAAGRGRYVIRTVAS